MQGDGDSQKSRIKVYYEIWGGGSNRIHTAVDGYKKFEDDLLHFPKVLFTSFPGVSMIRPGLCTWR